MATWTNESLKQLIAGASQATRELNPKIGDTGPVANGKPDLRRQLPGPAATESQDQSRYVVIVESYRHRHTDDGALSDKWHTDALVTGNIIPTDHPTRCLVSVVPFVVAKDQPEKIIIEVWQIA